MNSNIHTSGSLLERIRALWHKRLHEWRYFIIIAFVYAGWKGYKQLYYHSELLTAAGVKINYALSSAYMRGLEMIAVFSGESFTLGEMSKDGNLYHYIQLAGSGGIYIGWHCLAIPTMVVFTGSILFFRGTLVQKLWYITAGNVIICLVNLFRLSGLMFLDKYSTANFFRFNHSFTYMVLTYTVVFLLLIYYMRKLEPPLRHSPAA